MGYDAFYDLLRQHQRAAPELLVSSIFSHVLSYTQGNPLDDDMTILAIQRKDAYDDKDLGVAHAKESPNESQNCP